MISTNWTEEIRTDMKALPGPSWARAIEPGSKGRYSGKFGTCHSTARPRSLTASATSSRSPPCATLAKPRQRKEHRSLQEKDQKHIGAAPSDILDFAARVVVTFERGVTEPAMIISARSSATTTGFG